VCFGILKHLERTSFHFTRPEIFQGMLINISTRKTRRLSLTGSFSNLHDFRQIPDLLDHQNMFHIVFGYCWFPQIVVGNSL